MTREEAINKVRQMSLPKETKEILEALAPELRESEDERIRKHLIEIVETYWGKTNEPGKAADLAWLEKQKEPHYTKRNALFDKCVENCDPKVMKEVSDKVDEMLGKPSCWNSPIMTHEMIMDEQKEQKPVEYLDKDKIYAIMIKLTNLSYSTLIPINSDEFKKLHEITSEVRSLLDYPIEQKPAEWSEDFDKEVENIHKRYPEVSFAKLTRIAYHFSKWANRHKDMEWSEEDEKMLARIIERGQSQIPMFQMGLLPSQIAWLKSLPERFNLQSKQEWSEEDEVYLEYALWCVERAEKSCKDGEDKGACWSARRWLKSLRPQLKTKEEEK